MRFNFSEELSGAIHFDTPIVALESTVIAHGLPQPQNLETALSLEKTVRENGATPATIAVFDGEFYVGLSREQLEQLASGSPFRKISRRDLPIAAAKKLNCATTVSTTAFAAHRVGIRVFATGGIGGVHRGNSYDVSADLPELARTPIIVVCSGAKSVLDLPATREWLETYGVTVLGWQCDEMPAFYSTSSHLCVDERVETPDDVARIAEARNALGMQSALLVTVPVPSEFAIENEEIEAILDISLENAERLGITGKAVTPYLLGQLSEKSNGDTLTANIALLENNARVAAQIAASLSY